MIIKNYIFTEDLNKHNFFGPLINETCVQRSTSKNMNGTKKKMNLFILYFGCKTNNDDNTSYKIKYIIHTCGYGVK